MVTEATYIFISYSHDSDDHKRRVRELAKRLIKEGLTVVLDQYQFPPPVQGWDVWSEQQARKADYVLVICTAKYCRRFDDEAPVGTGRGVRAEAQIIRQILYDANQHNEKFIAVLLEGADENSIPLRLKPHARYRLNAEYEDLYRHLTNQPPFVPPALGLIQHLPLKEWNQDQDDFDVVFRSMTFTIQIGEWKKTCPRRLANPESDLQSIIDNIDEWKKVHMASEQALRRAYGLRRYVVELESADKEQGMRKALSNARELLHYKDFEEFDQKIACLPGIQNSTVIIILRNLPRCAEALSILLERINQDMSTSKRNIPMVVDLSEVICDWLHDALSISDNLLTMYLNEQKMRR